MATVSEYGTWKSPISSAIATEKIVHFQQLQVDKGSDNTARVFWNEMRPAEEGRSSVCSWNSSEGIVQWTPAGGKYNVRTRVHEYGGGSFFVHNNTIYFSNDSNQNLYMQNSQNSDPVNLSEKEKDCRYTDGEYNERRGIIYCVCEDHSKVVKKEAKEPANYIVAFDMENHKQHVVAQGSDFYSSPRASPDGTKLAWVQWNHPNMPWDSTEIWVGDLNENCTAIVDGTAKKVAGGKDASGSDISVMHPGWTKENDLVYIGDQTNWWNLYIIRKDGKHINLREVNEEIGVPHWGFGTSRYDIDPSGSGNIATAYSGVLGVLNMNTSKYKTFDTGFASHDQLKYGADGNVYCIGESPTRFSAVIKVNPQNGQVSIIKAAKETTIDNGYFSVPEAVTWKTGNDEISHGYYYPPNNKDYKAPEGSLPPLLVDVHGGPTNCANHSLKLKIQYFTSRGFAYLDVNYRGSTGYGKEYRHRLRGQWGVTDVEDCSSGAIYLAETGRADRNKLCIGGRSAGGFTVMACLTQTDVFKAGTSRYGVADIGILVEETHKFESRYIDSMIAPYNESNKHIFDSRSPIKHIDKLKAALLLFQGDEDKVVPPNQAIMMYDQAKANKVPCCLVMYKGEQHGFRIAENIRKTMDGEFYFYSRVFGFQAADTHCELEIENL